MLNRMGAWWNGVGKRWKRLRGIFLFFLAIGLSFFIEFILKKRIFSWVAKLLVMHWEILVFIVFAMFMRLLYLKIHRFEKYVAPSFKDDFKSKKDLDKNWDYKGNWLPISGGGLSVTRSEIGGITRVGHLWTDYSFEFTGVIVTPVIKHQCIGWIVRAQDLSNYYMIQLTRTEVRPHLRFKGQWIRLPGKKYGLAIDSKEHGLSIEPKEQIRIRTEVKGLEIHVQVNNKEVYHKEDFFSMRFINKEFELVPFELGVEPVPFFMAGRVGFREHGEEHGEFSRCRVRPL